MKTRIVLSSALVCLANILFSQQIFKGKIENEAKQPLTNVAIFNTQDSSVIYSDEKGNFEIEITKKNTH